MIVLDASAVVELLLDRVHGAWVVEKVRRAGRDLHSPHLVDAEVSSAVRRLVTAGVIDEQRGALAIEDLASLPLRRYALVDLLPRIWTLSRALSSYDASYVALAEVLRAPLVSADRRLADATGHEAVIELPPPVAAG